MSHATKADINFVLAHPAWTTSGVLGPQHLRVLGPFGRGFAQCAACDRLVHEEVEFGGFCCISCLMRHFKIGNAIEKHGGRCENRLANEIDFSVYRDLDGNQVTGPFVAEPVLPCKTVCSKRVQDLFEEAGLELRACLDQSQDSCS